MRGIFYNSKKALCSIWESGVMCYETLKQSKEFELDYTEDFEFKYEKDYDFAIVNQHFTVNNWITKEDVQKFGKPVFCIVTEVALQDENKIKFAPDFFTAYIVIDPSIEDYGNVYGFPRPLESAVHLTKNENKIPIIGSFGFATEGKRWDLILEQVAEEFEEAIVRFNIPGATHVPFYFNMHTIAIIKDSYNKLKNKNIKLEFTMRDMNKEELVKWCSENDVNVFFYYREKTHIAGLAAATDQAISSERPILVTKDPTFRHIHKYIDYYPNITIKDAIEKTQEGVKQMKEDWSSENFVNKFNYIIKKLIN